MYRTDLGYLERIRWVDGTRVYCRKCDKKVAMWANLERMLVDSAGHLTHPAQAIVSGEVSGEL